MKPSSASEGSSFAKLIELETRKIRNRMLVFCLLILTSGLTSTTYLNQRTTCETIYSRYEAISDSVARELALDNPGMADALLATFRASLGTLAPRTIVVSRVPTPAPQIYQCTTLMGWTQFEIPVLFGTQRVGVIRGEA